MSSKKRKEASLSLTQVTNNHRTQSSQHPKKTKTKVNTFSFTQEEEENDVLWLDASQTAVTDHVTTRNTAINVLSTTSTTGNSTNNISSGSAKSVLASTASSRGSARRKDKDIEKSASKSGVVLNLMNSLLESINSVDLTSSVGVALPTGSSQARKSVGGRSINTASQQVPSLTNTSLNPDSTTKKSIDGMLLL